MVSCGEHLLTPAMAAQAIDLAIPSIEKAFELRLTSRNDLFARLGLRNCPDERSGMPDTVLAERSFGDRDAWAFPYDEIAVEKYYLSVRTGLDSRLVQLAHPLLLRRHDVIYWGSVVVGDLVVACSGVQPWFDEAFARTIAAFCQALAENEQMRLRELTQTYLYDGTHAGASYRAQD